MAALQLKVCQQLRTIPRQVKAVTSSTRSQDVGQQSRARIRLRDSGQGQTQPIWSPSRAAAARQVQGQARMPSQQVWMGARPMEMRAGVNRAAAQLPRGTGEGWHKATG